MSIASEITAFRQSLPEGVRLVAVSKFHPVEALREAYDAGQRTFGESRAQELSAKQKEMPADVEWHFIGPLQSNKVKEIAPFIHLIHSIDSLRLLEEVDKQAKRHGRVIPILLEIHVAQEETKHGLTPDECRELLKSGAIERLENISLHGLMTMASLTDDPEQIRREFHSVRALFDELRQAYGKRFPEFRELSMGMSHDYPIAIEQGATLIRVGTKIFGERAIKNG